MRMRRPPSEPPDRHVSIERAPITAADVDVKQLGAPQQARRQGRAALGTA
jgi:hypothetical protein